MKVTARDVQQYLNGLSLLKDSSKKPFRVEVDGPLYHVFDADGLPIATFSKQMYELFNEL